MPVSKPDGRTYAAGKPKQVTKQQNAKRTRCHRKRMKAEEDMKEAQKELGKVERKLATKQQFLELMSQAPTPAQQRKALLAMFHERGISPIEELMNFTDDPDVDKKDKIAIWKELCSYTQPKLKSVDVQGTLSGEMKIMTVDYSKVAKSDLAKSVEGEIVGEQQYDEFLSEEEKHDSG
tara:strand:+ start:1748 stop:2281 length:534 start_codon:yes stop_codon:yes gene_type:complete